ncbi:UNVERIFIED_CONTAM: hypothetical protein Slati_4078200 [Sesamum latifolium]|uniref:Rubredoxin-like domain-containing protein n=1 Tax=Sesamum latifolium TaxID=2727402 RepID=A0AAW2T6T9_9LAMI
MAASAAATSSSCTPAAFTRNLPNSNCLSPHFQKTSFQGLSLQDAKTVAFTSLVAEISITTLKTVPKRGLQITARTAGAAKNIEVEVDKPLGLTLGQKQGGGVVITAVENGGNAARAGLKAGTRYSIPAASLVMNFGLLISLASQKLPSRPSQILSTLLLAGVRTWFNGDCTLIGAEVDVKKLPKRPAPPAFGRKLTDAQKARATHICLDCGYIYTLQKPFDEQADEYACPQCRAPKKRFAKYDVNTGKAIGAGVGLPIGVIIGLLVGVGGVGALLVYGLQ